jgi:hypothetical protein
MKVEIPETVLSWFRQLGELDDRLFEAVLNGLKNSPIAEDFASASRQLRQKVPAMQGGFVDECLSALIMGGSIANHLRLDAFAFGRMLAERVTLAQGSGSISDTSMRAAERFGSLLASSGAINLIVKAYDIASEVPRRIFRSRILTDARPVFGDDASGRPSAVVIMHTLALSFYEGNELRQFHINCDATSLGELQDATHRAIEKQRTLEEVFRDSSLRVLAELSLESRGRV